VPDNYSTVGDGASGQKMARIAFCAPDRDGELKDIQKTMKISNPGASGLHGKAIDEPATESGRPRSAVVVRGGGGGG